MIRRGHDGGRKTVTPRIITHGKMPIGKSNHTVMWKKRAVTNATVLVGGHESQIQRVRS